MASGKRLSNETISVDSSISTSIDCKIGKNEQQV
jgi:hypothetical protein